MPTLNDPSDRTRTTSLRRELIAILVLYATLLVPPILIGLAFGR